MAWPAAPARAVSTAVYAHAKHLAVVIPPRPAVPQPSAPPDGRSLLRLVFVADVIPEELRAIRPSLLLAQVRSIFDWGARRFCTPKTVSNWHL